MYRGMRWWIYVFLSARLTEVDIIKVMSIFLLNTLLWFVKYTSLELRGEICWINAYFPHTLKEIVGLNENKSELLWSIWNIKGEMMFLNYIKYIVFTLFLKTSLYNRKVDTLPVASACNLTCYTNYIMIYVIRSKAKSHYDV